MLQCSSFPLRGVADLVPGFQRIGVVTFSALRVCPVSHYVRGFILVPRRPLKRVVLQGYPEGYTAEDSLLHDRATLVLSRKGIVAWFSWSRFREERGEGGVFSTLDGKSCQGFGYLDGAAARERRSIRGRRTMGGLFSPRDASRSTDYRQLPTPSSPPRVRLNWSRRRRSVRRVRP